MVPTLFESLYNKTANSTLGQDVRETRYSGIGKRKLGAGAFSCRAAKGVETRLQGVSYNKRYTTGLIDCDDAGYFTSWKGPLTGRPGLKGMGLGVPDSLRPALSATH